MWFSNKGRVDSNNELEEYIISGGVFGTAERTIAARKQRTGTKFGYFIKRLFLPYNEMKHGYPVLKKFPFLLPVCWGIRWFKMLNPTVRKRLKNEMNYVNDDNTTGAHIEKLMKQLEIW